MRTIAIACIVVVAAACDTSASEPAPACIERTEKYSTLVGFPYDGSLASNIERPCIPTCGYTTHAMGYPVAAMPAGPCGGKDAFTCDMPIIQECRCPGTYGALNGFRCACVDGRWSCTLSSPGGSGCSYDGPGRCPYEDAGAD